MHTENLGFLPTVQYSRPGITQSPVHTRVMSGSPVVHQTFEIYISKTKTVCKNDISENVFELIALSGNYNQFQLANEISRETFTLRKLVKL